MLDYLKVIQGLIELLVNLHVVNLVGHLHVIGPVLRLVHVGGLHLLLIGFPKRVQII